ncbi:hypothetical protein ACWGLG_11420 [Streptomyces antimycoticus]
MPRLVTRVPCPRPVTRGSPRPPASGRFAFPSAEIALSALGGSLLALLDLHLAQPDANGDEAAAAMAEMMLRMLGVPADEALDIADRPLPAHD